MKDPITDPCSELKTLHVQYTGIKNMLLQLCAKLRMSKQHPKQLAALVYSDLRHIEQALEAHNDRLAEVAVRFEHG